MKQWAALVRLGGIGDNLIASSILPHLAKDYQVEVICQDPHHAVFENNPFISKLTVKKSEDFPNGPDNAWQKWFVERSKEYAKFVHLSHTVELGLALVPAQTAYWWPQAVRHKLCNVSYLEFAHDVAEVPHVFNPRFYPTDEELAKARETKSRVGERAIGWCISGSRVDKIHPHGPFIVARLIRETGLPVIMFGGRGNDLKQAKIIQEVVERQNGSLDGLHCAISPDPDAQQQWSVIEGQARIKLHDKPAPLWPIRRSLTQVGLCDLVIGPDTGLMWAVSMLDMPKIIMVGHAGEECITKHWRHTITLHADPKRVPCHPCHRLIDSMETCVFDKDKVGPACMADISVEDVVSAAKSALRETANLRAVA